MNYERVQGNVLKPNVDWKGACVQGVYDRELHSKIVAEMNRIPKTPKPDVEWGSADTVPTFLKHPHHLAHLNDHRAFWETEKFKESAPLRWIVGSIALAGAGFYVGAAHNDPWLAGTGIAMMVAPILGMVIAPHKFGRPR